MSDRPNVDVDTDEWVRTQETTVGRYGSLDAIPYAGPDAGLGPDVHRSGVAAPTGSFPTDSDYTPEQKREALRYAESKIDRKINGGEPIDPPHPPDLGVAANCYATYWLLLPSSHITDATKAELAGGGTDLTLAREYQAIADGIVDDLDEDEDVSGDEDSNRTHGGFAKAVTPGGKRRRSRTRDRRHY